jgi:hypothetical protein
MTCLARPQKRRIQSAVQVARDTSWPVIGSSKMMIFSARRGSSCSRAKKKASANVRRSPVLSVFRNAATSSPVLSLPRGTGVLLISSA